MISIHVPRVGDDLLDHAFKIYASYFNPRPPCGGRPHFSFSFLNKFKFQSTSPVWGTTGVCTKTCVLMRHFNPRPPCGGRPFINFYDHLYRPFQSTSPVWGTTITSSLDSHPADISIHVPRVGDDFRCSNKITSVQKFQSTSPVWGTTIIAERRIKSVNISIHVPRVGDDYPQKYHDNQGIISIHVPRVGDDRLLS